MEAEQNSVAKIPWYKYKKTKHDGNFFVFWQFLAATIIIIGSAWIMADSFLTGFDEGTNDNSASATTDSSSSADSTDQNCNVTGINLHGEVMTYISPADYDKDGNITVDETASENVIFAIRDAEKDDKIKAIAIEIDSYGGSPVAGEEIAIALKNAKKPTVAFIRGAGDSAAYWAATGANTIFASKNSDVGSLGVTMSYLDASKQNKKEGLTYNQLSAGKFKDTGNSDKPLTAEESKLLMRDVNLLQENFIQAVSANRKLGVDKVKSMADGSTMLGDMAVKNGLVDKIGGIYEVKEYLKSIIGAEPEICWQ